jgi:nitroreductase
MIVPQGKTEFDPMKSKIYSLDDFPNEKKSKNFGLIFLILLVILLFVLLYFSISINNKTTTDLKNQLQQKDLEIEKIKKQLEDLTQSQNSQQKEKQVEKRQIEQTLTPLDKEYLYDKDFYKKYNMGTEESLNKLGYESIIHTHTLEKGMEHFELRPFAVEKTRYIMSLIKRESKYENYENKFAFINGINSLREYKKIYEEHNWINKDEYKKVDEFLKNYSKVENQKAGAYILTKKELQNDYQIDYLKFVKSRHSTRNYKNEPIKLDDVKAAVEMAKYSASACNRQYIKLHFYPSGKMRDNVIHYALGKGGLYLDGVNTFIVTFDVNGLSGIGERNQGYFNAGLYSTNLVNAFHSLGIGTCFIQFANSVKDEDDLKRKNEIPEYERIAVILFAGYYDEKSIFAVSPRKNVSELLIEHK